MATKQETTLVLNAEDRTAAAFRSIESSMRGLEQNFGRLSGLMAGFAGGALVAAFGAAIRASEDAAQAQRKLDAVLRATGNTTGYTSEQLSKLADNLERTSKFDAEGFKEATATLVRFGNIGGENLEKVLKLSADYAALTGGDLVSASEKLGQALNNPAEGLKRLARNFGDLGKETEDAIKLQTDMGNSSRALEIAIEALQKKIGGADEASNQGLTGSVNKLTKAFGELVELAGEAANNGFFTGVLDATTARLRGLKAVLEEGSWVDTLMRLGAILNGNAPGAMLAAIGNVTPPAVTPGASGGGGSFSLADQDQRALQILERNLQARNAAASRANDELLREQERYRQLDNAGWVAYIEELERQWDQEARDMAKITGDRFKEEERLREESLRAEEKLTEEYSKRMAQARELELRAVMRTWDEISSFGADFFTDLVMNGKSAFDRLRQSLKQLLADMIALFAKKWILQLGAAAMGGAGTSAGASMLEGASSLYSNAGMVGSILTTGAAVYSGFTGAAALSGAAAAGTLTTTAGVGVAAAGGGSMTAVGVGSSLYTALAAIPVWGWIAMAVIAAFAYFSGRGGGPKPGGSFMGDFDSSGNFVGTSAVPGTDNGRFFTPTSGDSAMRDFTTQFATGFFDTLTRYGGTTSGLSFGFGFDQDPEGRADSRFSSMVRDSAGNIIYSNTQTAGRDDEDMQRVMGLETSRAIVAGLQASDLPESIALIFDSIDPLTASAEQLAQAFKDADLGMSILALGITGLDFQTLQNFQANGETLEQTFQRVGGAWAWFQDNFTTDAEKLERAQQQVTDVFASLGIEIPASLTDFRLLVEGIDLSTEAGRTLWSTLMGVAPSFLLVANAAGDASTATEDLTRALEEQAELQRRIEESVRDSRMRQLDAVVNARSGLQGFLGQTLLDPSITVLTPQERLEEARRQYEEVLNLARSGDLGAAGRLGGVADTYARIARELFASSSSYVDIFNRITSDVQGVDARLAIDEQMLRATLGISEAANAQVLLLEDVKSLLIDIRDKGAETVSASKVYRPR